ncbi:MAG TPA: hypothetical protein VLL72_00020, partial [Kiloniellales bacterium]|nr:hypothetical protein [Kiloniellales bacterium]
MTRPRFKGALLDLGGVVYLGDSALPGAVDAVGRLRDAGVAVRFLTNTTRRPRRVLLERLARIGLPAEPEELFMPAIAARRYLADRGLTPRLLIHPNLEEDFADLPAGDKPALVVGDAADGFTYAALNDAFRTLEERDAVFLALARNRSFRNDDGRMSLDTGAFVAALEYATGREATVLGKPSADFFAGALASLGCAP